MKKSVILLIICLSIISLKAQTLYRIDSDNNTNPSYIFGTHHLAPVAMADSLPDISKIFKDCDALVGEIDMTGNPVLLALASQKYMMAPSDSTLNYLLTKEEFSSLAEKFKPFSPAAQVTLYNLASLRPMAISSIITIGMMKKELPDFDAEQQLDSYFQKKFKAAGKDIIALETPEMQAQLLYTSIPIPKQLCNLQEILDDPTKAMKDVDIVNKLYFSGDLESLLEQSLSENSDPEFTEALLTARNHKWMETLADIIDSKPVFIAVGALHLPGKDGILNLLLEKGFKLTPLN